MQITWCDLAMLLNFRRLPLPFCRRYWHQSRQRPERAFYLLFCQLVFQGQAWPAISRRQRRIFFNSLNPHGLGWDQKINLIKSVTIGAWHPGFPFLFKRGDVIWAQNRPWGMPKVVKFFIYQRGTAFSAVERRFSVNSLPFCFNTSLMPVTHHPPAQPSSLHPVSCFSFNAASSWNAKISSTVFPYFAPLTFESCLNVLRCIPASEGHNWIRLYIFPKEKAASSIW